MCGRFQLKKTSASEAMMRKLRAAGCLHYSDDAAPGSRISFIRQTGSGERVVETATWWLFLDPSSLKPNYKYASFNTRSDKLHLPRSLGYRPYRESRCIVPATAFCEGLGDRKTYHMIEHEGRAIAFGGLYKAHANRETGELVYSVSIITLPPVPGWEQIHPKSVPLMLDYEDSGTIDRWLDPGFRDVALLQPLLEPAIRFSQRITPIGKPSRWNPVGASWLLAAEG